MSELRALRSIEQAPIARSLDGTTTAAAAQPKRLRPAYDSVTSTKAGYAATFA